MLVKHHDGMGIQDSSLPGSLTLNGLVAFFSTKIRASLMVPVASTLSHDTWVWLSRSG